MGVGLFSFLRSYTQVSEKYIIYLLLTGNVVTGAALVLLSF